MASEVWSLERRLRAHLLLSLAVLWLLGTAAALIALREEAGEVLDSAMIETAQRLMMFSESALAMSIDESQAAAFDEHEEYVVYQVFDPLGRMAMRSHRAPATPLLPGLVAGAGPAFVDHEGWHVLGLRRSDGRRTVFVAESRAHRREVLWESSLGLLAPLLAVLPLAAWVLHRVLRAAFRTLEPSRLMLDGSRGDVLQALPIAGLPQELHPLVLALNGLIERVHLLLDGERSFAARTAHELRTPLAAARAQAQRLQQLAGGGDIADRAQALVRQLDRITALATRLLQLARIESGVAWRRERVDLALLARMVVDEFAEGRTGGRLHWQASSDAGGVLGDADALGIALRNLIDNALRHGGAAARVDVEIGPGRIVVRDDGPGVGEGELARLLRPFERGNAAVEGSGLGLAMVSTVARQSDARLALRSPVSGGRGFEAELSLPVA